MDQYCIRPLGEADIEGIVEAAGGAVAHPDASRRRKRGADFVFDGAVIELKFLDEDGFLKTRRQQRLASLFFEEGTRAPVDVIDREKLSAAGRRSYDRAIEGPIKTQVASARKQLKQTRAEFPNTTLSVLWVVNNGYTALNHDDLERLVGLRARNDTRHIDGVIVGGCYFRSDGVNHVFDWRLTYVPIKLAKFAGFDSLLRAWSGFASKFMSDSMKGEMGQGLLRGPVVDCRFEFEGITYVKPAPPMGKNSDFYPRGHPRTNSSGIDVCPPVGLTFPGLTHTEWMKVRQALPNEAGICESYAGWLAKERDALREGTPLCPLVRVPITCFEWQSWCQRQGQVPTMVSVRRYANSVFQDRVQTAIANARELKGGRSVVARYILVVTDEIGQDKANDLSHIAKVFEQTTEKSDIRSIAENLRVFHEHAIALASSYAVAEGWNEVMWVCRKKYSSN